MTATTLPPSAIPAESEEQQAHEAAPLASAPVPSQLNVTVALIHSLIIHITKRLVNNDP